jgi:hypothetical protein
MALPKLTVLGAMGSVMHPEGKAGLTAKLFKPYSKAYWNGLSRWEKATQIVGAPALAPFHLTGNVLEAAGKVQSKNALSMLNAGLVHGIEGTTGKRRWLENRIRRPLNIGGDYAYEAGVDFGKRMRNNNILSIKELTPAHYQQALQSAGDAFQARSGAVGALANRFGVAPNFTSTAGHVFQELAADDPLTRMGRVFTRPEGMGMVEQPFMRVPVWQFVHNITCSTPPKTAQSGAHDAMAQRSSYWGILEIKGRMATSGGWCQSCTRARPYMLCLGNISCVGAA